MFRYEFKHSEEVNVLTLDSCQQLAFVQPDLVKMDVEGHELEVLKGVTETLRSVQVVQFEFGGRNIDSKTFFQDFYCFFRDYGFDIFRLQQRGLLPAESYTQLDETFATTNYFAQRRQASRG